MWNGKRKYKLKNCNNCGKEFKSPLFTPNRKFCSYKCFVSSGILQSKERREKIKKSLKGRIYLEKWKIRLSNARKGKKYPKLSEAKKGKKFSKYHKSKISDGQKRAFIEGRTKIPIMYGESNPNWRNGVSDKNHLIRTSAKFIKWREKVYNRDKYICQKCGDKKGGNLHPHHIKLFSSHLELRFRVSNGITLCKKCHQNIHKGKNYGQYNTN